MTSTTNTYLPIGYGIRLSQTYASSIDSYTVTRNTNSLNFNINTVRGFRICFMNASAALPANTTYTLVAEFSTTTPIEYFTSKLLLLDNGSGRTYDYYSGPQNLGNNRYRVVCITRSDINANAYLNFDGGVSGSTTSVNINLTLHYIAAYKGSFVNPPTDISSLDVNNSTNQFVTRFEQGKNQTYSVNHTDGKQHWLRLVKLQGKGTSAGITDKNAATMLFWKGFILRPWRSYDVLVLVHIYAGVLWTIESSSHKYFGYFMKGYRSVNKTEANFNYLGKFRIAKDTTDNIDTNSTHPSVYLEALCPTSGSGNLYYMIPEIGFAENESTWGQIKSNSFVSNIAQGTYNIIGDNDNIIGNEYTPEALGSQITWPF